MSIRNPLAQSVAPLFLRAALGVTFLWAGLGKLLAPPIPVSPEQAVLLASWGVIPPAAAADPVVPEPAAEPAPVREAPQRLPEPAAPAEPVSRPASEPVSPVRVPAPPALMALQPSPAIDPRLNPDLATPPRVKRLYSLAFLTHAAANPRPDADGRTPMPLWPAELGKNPWPVRAAWAVTITEIVAGAFLILGLLTRLSALSLAGVMLGALWLTQIGPAVQSGNTTLGFLPAHAAFDVSAWKDILWQFGLLCSAMALACVGSGTLAFDRALLGRSAHRSAPAPAAPPPRPI